MVFLYIFNNTPQHPPHKARRVFLTTYYLLLITLYKLSAHKYTHNRCHHQASCPARGVTEAVKSLYVCVELVIHLDTVGVELQLR